MLSFFFVLTHFSLVLQLGDFVGFFCAFDLDSYAGFVLTHLSAVNIIPKDTAIDTDYVWAPPLCSCSASDTPGVKTKVDTSIFGICSVPCEYCYGFESVAQFAR